MTPVFVMKIIDLNFMDGKFGIKLLAFRRKNNWFVKPNGEQVNYNNYNMVSTIDNSQMGPAN